MFVDIIKVQQIWDDMPEKIVNKAINNFCERLNACILADVDILSILYELGSRT